MKVAMFEYLVLFDIDGTLLHSGGCGRAATRLALEEVFGTVGTLDKVSFAGKTDWQIVLESLVPAGISAEQVQTSLPAYDQAVARHLSQLVAGFPVRACVGALEVVAALRSDPQVLVGLVTGNMAGLVPIKLRAAGFDPDDFKVGAFGSEGSVRAMLPPLALARAGAYAGREFSPEWVVIVGDTPGDIACAASIGARTLAVATGPFNVTELRACHPDHLFETLAHTASVLDAIFQNGRAG
jgi:phosphoglycolate phosphatase-like HAD superfamily hydrolase